ncbi:hypothetical protein AB0L63_21170 [Nocardia sp. NPDC051990]|uniref:hypothetical protein n=1 Tax=Nocardia sp. NPDC051990 TaxID=3155285 RepID=UPI00341D9248
MNTGVRAWLVVDLDVARAVPRHPAIHKDPRTDASRKARGLPTDDTGVGLGAGFSLMEGTTVLREILSRYTLAPPEGAKPERERVRNITIVPRDKARIVVTPRSTS